MKINQLKYTEKEIKQFGEYYQQGHSLKETSEKFNVNYHTLKQNLIRFGYRTPSKKLQKQRVAPINYFSKIDSHEKAYFLGLFFSDGYISSTPYGKNLGIGLQKQDRYILEFLKNEWNVNNKISDYKNSSKLQVTCEQLYKDLLNSGILETWYASFKISFGTVSRYIGFCFSVNIPGYLNILWVFSPPMKIQAYSPFFISGIYGCNIAPLSSTENIDSNSLLNTIVACGVLLIPCIIISSIIWQYYTHYYTKKSLTLIFYWKDL